MRVTDMFSGAGGTSQGAQDAGFEVQLALNHSKLAVETHNTNFPNTDHYCADVSQVDPRQFRSTEVLLASPECTNHSIAKGVRRNLQQRNFFTEPDPVAERSRATMWCVVRFAEHHRYPVVVVENVVDARKWVLWDSWVGAMSALGYDHKLVCFNSQFAPPTPQSRDRIYCVFWRRGMKKPDLEFRPPATCPAHGRIESYQAWKPGRAYGKYKQQYLYRCPSCHSEVVPDYSPAYNAIDWELPIKRVGDRKIPLKEKTIQRIRVGLQRYVEPFLLNHGLDASYRLTSEALQTIVAGGNHLFLVTTSHSHAADGGKVKPGDGPLPTLTTCQDQGFVVSPLIMGNYTPGWSRPVTGPLGAITTDDHHSLLVPPGFQFSYRSNGDGQPVIDGLDNPLKTITTETQHYLTSYYSGSTQISPMTAPMPTIPTKERHALVRGEINVDDCGFRMLDVHELQAGMAFPSDYVFLGTKKQQVAMIGNAVTPPVMRMILSRCREILN